MWYNLGGKALTDLPVTLTKGVLPKLATKAISSVLDKFDRKVSGSSKSRKKDSLCSFQMKIWVISLKS